MKLKKIIFSFAIIIFMLQSLAKVICNATEDKSQRIVLNDFSEIQNNLEPVQEEIENRLNIYSEAAILIEAKTGKILYDKDIYSRMYPASTTKILTAIIAIENCDLEEKAKASYRAVFSVKSGYSIANIQEGESFTIRELLEVLMIQSANEAANVIAEHISGSVDEFAKLMNKKAQEIGCLNSNFINANGVHNENHYSTAYDLAMIAKYCMQNATFREIAQKQECSLPQTEIYQEDRIFRNTNSLMQQNSRYYYPYCTGIKTGFTTPAKNCLIASSNKNDFELITVVLHAETTEDGSSARYLDTINLFEYGYNNFNLKNILEEKNNIVGSIVNEETNNEEQVESSSIKDEIQDNFLTKLENEEIIETVTSGVKKEYNSSENDTDAFSWFQIILGTAIIVIAGRYYLIKSQKNRETLKKIRDIQEKQMKKDNLYSFKLG